MTTTERALQPPMIDDVVLGRRPRLLRGLLLVELGATKLAVSALVLARCSDWSFTVHNSVAVHNSDAGSKNRKTRVLRGHDDTATKQRKQRNLRGRSAQKVGRPLVGSGMVGSYW